MFLKDQFEDKHNRSIQSVSVTKGSLLGGTAVLISLRQTELAFYAFRTYLTLVLTRGFSSVSNLSQNSFMIFFGLQQALVLNVQQSMIQSQELTMVKVLTPAATGERWMET
jgi:hypothetical protein